MRIFLIFSYNLPWYPTTSSAKSIIGCQTLSIPHSHAAPRASWRRRQSKWKRLSPPPSKLPRQRPRSKAGAVTKTTASSTTKEDEKNEKSPPVLSVKAPTIIMTKRGVYKRLPKRHKPRGPNLTNEVILDRYYQHLFYHAMEIHSRSPTPVPLAILDKEYGKRKREVEDSDVESDSSEEVPYVKKSKSGPIATENTTSKVGTSSRKQVGKKATRGKGKRKAKEGTY